MNGAIVSSLFQQRGVVFVLLVVMLVGGLLLDSARAPVRSVEAQRHEAAAAVEDVVRAVAWYGPRELRHPRYQAAFASFRDRGTIIVLLSAWSRLSLGRLGILDVATATRLPWLLLASLAPALCWWVVHRESGPVPALTGVLIVLLFPGWWQSAIAGAPWTVVLSCCLLAVGIHGAPLRPGCRTGLIALVIGFWANVHVASSIALGVVAVRFWWTTQASGWRHGRATLPLDVVVAAAMVPLAAWLLNPALWGRSNVELLRWMLAALLPASSESLLAVGWASAGRALVAMGFTLAATQVVRRWRTKP